MTDEEMALVIRTVVPRVLSAAVMMFYLSGVIARFVSRITLRQGPIQPLQTKAGSDTTQDARLHAWRDREPAGGPLACIFERIGLA